MLGITMFARHFCAQIRGGGVPKIHWQVRSGVEKRAATILVQARCCGSASNVS